ncbi:hypothetical protein [Pseudomonas phage PA10]|nr:hypothetical protein PJG4_040 [Pseudomonas phage JG004]YP_009287427.1 hypothetical protein BIZ94_gp168 [Pseudomonas phage vB_PaeM_MAG1]YP_009291197.1 hypothetical protein BI047_gp061 [Pseudomonas phage phiMK]YP_009598025.1 hypothetical protein FDH20_gp100 [Pseudomonas phage PA10]YP_009598093.1 hypothetical protein FDH21_gp041 [Pseudomonas phage Zigelbrucke]YP_009623451.1 hypothetical protein FDJ38_gp044 [Pseudomonas phage vB_PaeM_C2-10_Ab02]YP_010762716.1 hypothetical protein QE326_gp041 [
MRDEFEAWFVRNYAAQIKDGHHGFTLDRYEHPPHQYIHDTPHHDWRIWQASRAALRVELPEKMEPTRNIYGNLIIGSYNAVLDAVKEALQQAGIEVK